jgi:hypothetical protein
MKNKIVKRGVSIHIFIAVLWIQALTAPRCLTILMFIFFMLSISYYIFFLAFFSLFRSSSSLDIYVLTLAFVTAEDIRDTLSESFLAKCFLYL